MQPFDLLVLVLATWRLAYLITKEDGPFKLAVRFRERFPLGGLTTCIFCASVWTAIVCYMLLLTPLAPIVYMAAASGGAMMLWRYTGGDHI
jgi:hypothetical protein